MIDRLGCWLVPLAIGAWLWTGFVLVKLWGWFVGPLLGPERADLPFSIALGLLLIAGELQPTPEDREPDERIPRVVKGAVSSLLALLLGGAVHGLAS